MKYVLYRSDSIIAVASVTMSPYQVSHMSTKGFAFGKELLLLANDSPSMNIRYVAIEDETTRVATIFEHNESLDDCLSPAAKQDYAQDTDQQLRCLGML